MQGVFVTCYISSGDEAEHHEDPQEHGANGGPNALSPPPPGTATSPRALRHQPSFPVGPGCTLGCSYDFSPPPSAAHDTQPTETTVMATLEQEVKLFDDFSRRKLPLQSSVTPKRQWKPAFQNRDSRPCIARCVLVFGALQGCSYQGEMDFPRGAVLFLYQEYIQTYAVPIITVEANSSFQVPGGQTWPLRKLCAQEAPSLLIPSSFGLPACFCLPSQPLGALTYFGSR